MQAWSRVVKKAMLRKIKIKQQHILESLKQQKDKKTIKPRKSETHPKKQKKSKNKTVKHSRLKLVQVGNHKILLVPLNNKENDGVVQNTNNGTNVKTRRRS